MPARLLNTKSAVPVNYAAPIAQVLAEVFVCPREILSSENFILSSENSLLSSFKKYYSRLQKVFFVAPKNLCGCRRFSTLPNFLAELRTVPAPGPLHHI